MLILLRAALVAAALGLWFLTQKLIAARPAATAGIGDKIHDWTAGWNRRLQANQAAQSWLLIISSLGIDLLGVFLLGAGIFGPSIRPFLGLLLLFGLRQVCQATTALPAPAGIIWRRPGFPSLLVTYDVGNDFFFSGHTAIAVYGAIEVARLGIPGLTAAAAALALFEVVIVLVLRAHWTIDVFAGAVTALWIAAVAPPLAAVVDGWLALL